MKGLDVRGSRIMGAVEEGWVVRSTDNGQTWQDITKGTHFDSHSVITMPNDPNVVISTSGHGVYRSEDGGLTFGNWSEGLDCVYMAQIVVHPSRPNVLFTAAAEVPPPGWRRPEGANAHFFRSENQGAIGDALGARHPDRHARRLRERRDLQLIDIRRLHLVSGPFNS